MKESVYKSIAEIMAFFDFEKNSALVILENMLKLTSFAFIGTSAAILTKNHKQNNSD